jgi:hypothetical protein
VVYFCVALVPFIKIKKHRISFYFKDKWQNLR